MAQLTQGKLAEVLGQDSFAGALVVQVLDVQGITPKDGGANNSSQRFKLTVSDGIWSTHALLASQLREKVDDGTIRKGAIIQVNETVSNNRGSAGNKKILIFLQIQPAGYSEETIGNPQPYNQGGPAGNSAPPPSGAAAPYGAPPAGMYGAGAANGMNGNQPGPGGAYGAPGQPAGNQYGGANGMNGYGGGGANPGGAGMYSAPPAQYGAPPPAQQPQQPPQQQYGAAPVQSSAAPGAAHHSYGNQAPYNQAPYGAGAAPQYGGYGGNGPVARNEAPPNIVPINSLNPYQARWTIKARCTVKSDVRRWNNARGEGKLFSFDLLDGEGGEIRVTGFKDAVDRWYDMVQVGKVYTISKASLRPRKPQFNATKHDYEIQLENNSTIEEVPDEGSIPQQQYHFKPIATMESVEAGSICDVVGVVERVENWQVITKRNGEDTKKRGVVLRDDSGRSIELTLWGDFVNVPGDDLELEVRSERHPVVAVKGARIGDFNGKTLSTISSTQVVVNPDLPEAAKLRHWYDNGGSAATVAPMSEARGGGGRQDARITLAQITDDQIGMRGGPEWVTVAATVNFIRTENMCYAGCPLQFNGRSCNKKLVGEEGSWYCERCAQSVPQPAWRYIVSMQVQDHTAQKWISAFGDSGDAILGKSAAEVHELEAPERRPEFEEVVAAAQFRMHRFRFKVAEDTWNDETRIKVSVANCAPTDYVRETQLLLENIRKLEAGQPVLVTPPPPNQQQQQGQQGGMAAGGAAGGGNYGMRQGGQQQQQQGGFGGGMNGNMGGGMGTAPGGMNGQGMGNQYGRAPANNQYGGGGGNQYGANGNMGNGGMAGNGMGGGQYGGGMGGGNQYGGGNMGGQAGAQYGGGGMGNGQQQYVGGMGGQQQQQQQPYGAMGGGMAQPQGQFGQQGAGQPIW